MTQGAFFDRSFESDTVPTLVGAFPRVVAVVESTGPAEVAAETLASLRRARYPDLQTLLVTDDGVGDEPASILDRFGEVTLIRVSRAQRGVPALNLGVEEALASGCDYVLLLSADAELDPGMLPELVDVAESSVAVGCAGPAAYHEDDRERPWPERAAVEFRWPSPRANGSPARRGARNGWARKDWRSGVAGRTQADERPVDREWLDRCGLLLRASVLEQIGLFDPTYSMVRADADWCLRAGRRGFRCRLVPKARLWRRELPPPDIEPSEVAYRQGREGALLARQYARGLEWARFWAGVAGVVPAAYLTGVMRGEERLARSTWRGVVDGLGETVAPPPSLGRGEIPRRRRS